jgi:hypothetical protein
LTSQHRTTGIVATPNTSVVAARAILIDALTLKRYEKNKDRDPQRLQLESTTDVWVRDVEIWNQGVNRGGVLFSP